MNQLLNNTTTENNDILSSGLGLKHVVVGGTLFNTMETLQERICGIYKITSPSGSIYIGQSVDIIRRFSAYKKLHCKAQPRLYRSFLKYGWDQHKFEIIHRCRKDDLNTLEIYYIKLFNTFGSKFGLNLRRGGNYTTFSVEHRENLSASQKGEKNHNWGKSPSQETKEKLSKASKGNKSQLGQKQSPETIAKRVSKTKGLKKSPEWCQKMSALHKGRIMSEESRRKMSLAHIGEKRSQKEIEKRSRPVLNLETGIFYVHAKEASEQTSMSTAALINRLTGKTKNNTSFIYA